MYSSRDIIEFIIVIVGEFARRHKMSDTLAFRYLDKYVMREASKDKTRCNVALREEKLRFLSVAFKWNSLLFWSSDALGQIHSHASAP